MTNIDKFSIEIQNFLLKLYIYMNIRLIFYKFNYKWYRKILDYEIFNFQRALLQF